MLAKVGQLPVFPCWPGKGRTGLGSGHGLAEPTKKYLAYATFDL